MSCRDVVSLTRQISPFLLTSPLDGIILPPLYRSNFQGRKSPRFPFFDCFLNHLQPSSFFACINPEQYRRLSPICKSEFFSKNYPPNCFYIVLPSVSSHCHHPPSHTTKKKTASSQSSLSTLHFFRQYNDISRIRCIQVKDSKIK